MKSVEDAGDGTDF